MKSQKPTRDERSWVIGMAEVGFNINYDAFHFDIHKTIAYRIINRFVQTKLAWDRPTSGTQNKNELHWRNVSYRSYEDDGIFFYSKPTLFNI